MKTYSAWNSRHYLPAHLTERAAAPYICRIAPSADGFSFDFLDPSAEAASYRLIWRLRYGKSCHILPLTEMHGSVNGLLPNTDYTFRVEREDGVSSTERLVRTGEVPGTIVTYLHPDDPEYAFSGRYLCSPCIIRLPSGRLLASMDLFAGAAPQNLTLIYFSDDDGQTWSHLTELFPCFWGKMFLHGDSLYMIACSTEYGDLLIGRSDDGGKTWTAPTTLLRGPCHSKEPGWHRAPMPVRLYGGRIMTDLQYGAWAQKIFCDAVISAPADADLLDSRSWVCTELFNPRHYIEKMPERTWGGIEGNVILAPDGRVLDILRYANRKLLVLNYDPEKPEEEMTLSEIADFPGTASKFNLEYDPVSGKYLAIVSYALDDPETSRNLLSLICTEDLKTWQLCTHLIDRRYDDPKLVGFQYVDFLIEGDDILYLCRTACNAANTYHNSNYTTFHRIKNFRSLL